MKQYIVLVSMIVLGLFIYGIIAGHGDSSVASLSGKVLKSGVEGMLGR